jgi:hypothetical protein
MTQDTETINHDDIVQVSRLFEEAFGDFGDDWLVGILFAHATEKAKQSAVQRALEIINSRGNS